MYSISRDYSFESAICCSPHFDPETFLDILFIITNFKKLFLNVKHKKTNWNLNQCKCYPIELTIQAKNLKKDTD